MLSRKSPGRKIPRLKGMTVARLIPNMITVASTCAGLTGIRYALEARWEFAVAAILVAALLDALDGRMARLLRATSDFGAQLDSLSDFVAFGVSPALIVWLWSLSTLGGPGWGIALFFAVCCGLRLARFNSRLDTLPPYAYNYFQGVPAPCSVGSRFIMTDIRRGRASAVALMACCAAHNMPDVFRFRPDRPGCRAPAAVKRSLEQPQMCSFAVTTSL